MARFPLPVLRRNPDTTEIVTSQEELEARFAVDQARHDEVMAEQKKQKEEAEKLREKEKRDKDKKDREQLQNQKKIFSDSLRTGLFGKLEFAFKQRDKLLDNTIEALKDSISDRIFGKSISDKEAENDGQVRTTVIERILTNQKYKEIVQEDSAKEDKPVSVPTENTPEPPKTDDGSSPSVPETVPSPDGVPVIIKDVTIERDLDSEKNQLPIFKKISDSLNQISSSITKYFKQQTQEEKNRLKAEASNKLLERSANGSFLGDVPKVDGKGLSFPFMIGIGTLITTITGVVAGAITTVASLIARAFPVAALATGLYLKIKDGIAGWFSAEAWGVRNISGMVGGLLGGLDEGVKGAIKNGGKWALVGAGIGSVVPVVGTLLGGLLGAGFGAILGYFGGEKIAKFVDGIINFVVDQWTKVTVQFDKIKKFFGDLKDTFINLKDQLLNFSFEDIKATFKTSIDNMYEEAKNWVKNLFTYDYWFGSEKDPVGLETKTKELSAVNKDGLPIKVLSDIDRRPIELAPDAGKGLFEAANSLDKLVERMDTPIAKSREIAVENLVEKTIENSVVNNTNNTNHADYSRTNTTYLTNNSTKAAVNILGMPSVRNNESSAWGTQGSINGGVGNFGRR